MLDSVPGRLLVGALVPVLRILLTIYPEGPQPDKFPPPHVLLTNYDFIIVGGGTAGSVLGARLSEVNHWNILVLEAGGAPPPESLVPGFSRVFYFSTDTTWKLNLHPQRYALLAYNNRSSPVPQGKVLGGSSTINGMLYVRGNRRDFNGWSAMGNDGWDYDSVLPYFKKSEGFTGPHMAETEAYHGRFGPLTVEPQKSDNGIFTNAFIRAAKALGFEHVDPTGPQQIGVAATDYTIKGGERWHSARAYLHPAIRRPNLHVLTNAKVTRVIFDENKHAVGVEYEHRRKIRKVFANKEVILSAGAIFSPHLLLLSGVGSNNQLHHHGIKVVHDLKGVGHNLQDHMSVYGLSWTTSSSLPVTTTDIFSPKLVSDYVHYRKGPFTTPLGDFGHLWAKVGNGEDPHWPDIQLFFLSSSLPEEGPLAFSALGIDSKTYFEHFWTLSGKGGVSILPYLMRPKSKGTVTLRSKYPHHKPIIDPKYFSDPDDLNTLVNGVKLAVRLGRTQPFMKSLGARFHSKPLRQCEHLTRTVHNTLSGHNILSDAYWRCYVKHMASTFYHFAGTCKMGPHSDPYSVVDSNLKVRGVSGLRVVDASVMPVVVSGNPMASVIMIAEKAADLIKLHYTPNTYKQNSLP